MDVSTSNEVNWFWYFKRNLIKWYRFRFERKCLKIFVSFMTSGDDRKWRQRYLTYLDLSTSQVYHPWKIQVSVFTWYGNIEKEILESVDTVYHNRKQILPIFLLLTWDIYNVYIMCKTEVKHFIHKGDIWLWKWDNEIGFFNNRKLESQLPVG